MTSPRNPGSTNKWNSHADPPAARAAGLLEFSSLRLGAFMRFAAGIFPRGKSRKTADRALTLSAVFVKYALSYSFHLLR